MNKLQLIDADMKRYSVANYAHRMRAGLAR